ncbi:MAG: GntG family PLP-dependent aldolase [Actinomycetota bacterium]
MPEDWVELRSDTFTKPSPEMRRAMAEADVGDDVFGEDPTVNALQERAAGMFGKEAALFVPTGTMGNETAIKVLTSPGDDVVIEAQAHIVNLELGAPATISHVVLKTIPGVRGVMDPEDVAAAIRPPSPLFSHTTLVSMENTHNYGGGTVWAIDDFRAVAKVAHERDCRVFLDGARIFNASVASGIPVAEYASEVDALSFCFSKGLGAPIGSMLVGSAEFVAEARKVRRMLGGGMRQVGVIAAAAAFALENNVDRLADDHANARRLAEGFAEALPGCIDPTTVETNIVIAGAGDLDAVALTGKLWDQGVRMYPTGPHRIRAVTHLDVDRNGIERAIEAFRSAVSN